MASTATLPGPDWHVVRLAVMAKVLRAKRVLRQEVGRTDVQASPASGSLAGRPVVLSFLGELL
jgi:hypothetical protein